MMTRKLAFLAAAVSIAVAGASTPSFAAAPSGVLVLAALADQQRPEGRRAEPSISASEAARRVASGREGRMLGIRPAGDGFVVRWEYPGGRVADIRVDGSGRVSGG